MNTLFTFQPLSSAKVNTESGSRPVGLSQPLALVLNRLEYSLTFAYRVKSKLLIGPIFGEAYTCRGNTCITELNLAHFRDYDLNEFFQKLAKEKGRDYSKIKSFLESVEDFEQPILLVFTLK